MALYIDGANDASKLDDYEEGGWTPTISSGTFDYYEALYVKIGQLVRVSAYCRSFSDHTSSNAVVIGGLPFASKSGASSQGAMFTAYFSTNDSICAHIGSATSSVNFFHHASGGDYDHIRHSTIADAGSNRRLFFTVTYLTET